MRQNRCSPGAAISKFVPPTCAAVSGAEKRYRKERKEPPSSRDLHLQAGEKTQQ